MLESSSFFPSNEFFLFAVLLDASACTFLPILDFVEWLLQLCASSLMPGVNYQRRKTALLLLAAILETCTDTWSPERKKGQPPRKLVCTPVLAPGQNWMCVNCSRNDVAVFRVFVSQLSKYVFPFPLQISRIASLNLMAGHTTYLNDWCPRQAPDLLSQPW